MSTREAMIRSKISEMRVRLAEAYLQDDRDRNEVLKLSVKLDRLILLDLKAGKSRERAG